MLIIDNFEHLLPAAPDVSHLLREVPGLTVLVTSRAALNVQGETRYVVQPLSLPTPEALSNLKALAQVDAVALFVERARAIRPDFELTEANAPVIAAICERLDGLPLALELAARHLRAISPQALLKRLDRRFHLLVDGPRDAPRRQRALQATLDWSFDLLAPDGQVVLRRLSVFAGGFTLRAAQAVCGLHEETDVLSQVESLLDHSLLQRQPRTEDLCFSMLETVRAYASVKLADAGEAWTVRARHARFFRSLAIEAAPYLMCYDTEQAAWIDRLIQEQENLRRALSWSIAHADDVGVEVGLELAIATSRFWHLRGAHEEGLSWLMRALDASSADGEDLMQLHAEAYHQAGTLMFYIDRTQAAALHEASLARWRRLEDKAGIGRALSELGYILGDQRDLTQGRHLIERAIGYLSQNGARAGLAQAYYHLADLSVYEAKWDESEVLAGRVAALGRETGMRWYVMKATGVRGTAYSNRIEYERARTLYGEMLAMAKEARDVITQMLALCLLGNTNRALGHRAEARRHYRTCITYRGRVGDRSTIGWAMWKLTYMEADREPFRVAIDRARESVRIAERTGETWLEGWALHTLGYILLTHDRLDGVRDAFLRSMAIGQRRNDLRVIVANLCGFAMLAERADQPARAARLVGAVEALIAASGLSRGKVIRADETEDHAARLAARLRDLGYRQILGAGRALTAEGPSAAIAYVRERWA